MEKVMDLPQLLRRGKAWSTLACLGRAKLVQWTL
jgi:hypothetical protein